MIDNVLVTIPRSYDTTHGGKIAAIKAIRLLTGYGLKEAKDLSEMPGLHNINIYLAHNSGISSGGENMFVEEQCRILRQNGCEVGPSVNLILQQLRDLGADALKQGEDDLANEILQLVLAEKLRRKP